MEARGCASHEVRARTVAVSVPGLPRHAVHRPIYAGQVSHKGKVYEGQHPRIVDDATWESVQAKLASHAHHRSMRQTGETALFRAVWKAGAAPALASGQNRQQTNL